MKTIQVLILLVVLLAQCKYTGGYDIVKGSKAISEIKEKVTRHATLGTLYTLASISNFTCPSSASANVFTEVEPNNTYKYATKFDFPTEEQSVRFQGTVTTGNSDYDIFYMVVPSDTTHTLFYHKGTGGCSVEINSDGSELNNDTSYYNPDVTYSAGSVYSEEVNSDSIQPSDYVFFFCNTYADNVTIDVEVSLTKIGSSSSSVNTEFLSSPEFRLSSATFGPTVFEISSGIDKNKYYTRSSVDECKKRLSVTVPVASLLDGYNFLLYNNCGAAGYDVVNPYFVAGHECKLQEADWIQIGDLGIP
ncbi:MAG: hypothetical protein H7A23_21155 [Leptospiraceae bacterium]|nr:hypothetical protein [Leptospiraceae bacterium]MCP5497072.1 hypothetical protein [Leptospiraceae bacterium]